MLLGVVSVERNEQGEFLKAAAKFLRACYYRNTLKQLKGRL